jgi:MFS family permease
MAGRNENEKGRRTVWTLGLVSFFTDVSSEMIFPLLAIFLNLFLGASKEVIGLIEGVADSAASLTDIVFGYFSDKSGKRKQFVLFGYGLSSIVKIGIAFANSWPMMLVLRGAERIGKSLRTSPRDAIIAGSVAKEQRGWAFGLHRAMDTTGAIVGPALAFLVLNVLGETEAGYRAVFQIAVIPAFIAVVLIALLIKEPKTEKKAKARAKPLGFWQRLGLLGKDYRRFLAISCIFSLAYFSFSFLLLRINELGVPTDQIVLLYLAYNIAYALVSVPAGTISDRFGRKPTIVAAFLLFAVVCLGFIFASDLSQVLGLLLIYGVFVATDESVNKAYIADIVGEKNRGTALGAYNSAVGAAYLPANFILGLLWTTFGAGIAFGFAAVVAIIASVMLATCKICKD